MLRCGIELRDSPSPHLLESMSCAQNNLSEFYNHISLNYGWLRADGHGLLADYEVPQEVFWDANRVPVILNLRHPKP